jgi:hypothetical protein
MKRFSILMVGAVLAFSVSGTALASGGGSTCQSYNPQTCSVISTTTTRTTTPTTSSTTPTSTATSTSPATTAAVASGTLPFTGLDVGLLLVGGGVLLGTGLLVRRFSRGNN